MKLTGATLSRFAAAVAGLSADEKKAAADAVRAARNRGMSSPDEVAEGLAKVIVAGERNRRRRASDRRTDVRRRATIGTRVSREIADRYRAAAAAEGVSVNAWVKGLLDKRAAELENAADPSLREL